MKELKIIELVIPAFKRDDVCKVSYMWINAGPFYYIPTSAELLGYLIKRGYLSPQEYKVAEKANGMFIYFTERRMLNDC